ncbi:hemin ABC transporter ATP-binding protein [Corynebacterium sp. HMSC08C04]|uniref:heme ABC transporter ATP-binding protein n=1 Tax=Corynebacterium sp. HMSC08C04 TaxID=1581137 RepID=UPI0008A5D5AA|nr:heme ABC transporter ATP-binding protein [Corynebacterium sp. HMSC08C04]OFT35344.1 hemin ABC transporter ATP-binding protein [Corynebacterium sp. HMSC08C04]
MISVRGLTVEIGHRKLVDAVSFDAQPGEVTGLIGPNGAGKSTVLAAVAGDLEYSGSVQLAELDPTGLSPNELARLRAVMLQDVGVSFEFLVRDVVAMGRSPWAGTSSEAEDEEIVAAALAAADVAHLAGRDVVTLSGGERARVALARVLAQQTPVILLDEPTAALDIHHQEQVLSLAQALAKQGGIAVLVVLHDLNAAAAYCDHIVCMADGKVVAHGTVPEVYADAALSEVYGWDITVAEIDGRLCVLPQRCPPTGIDSLISTYKLSNI